VLQQVANYGEDSIVYFSCKLHHVISVSTTVSYITILSPTYRVWSFLIVRSEVCMWKKGVCMPEHPCVYRHWCSHTGWQSAKWLS